MNDRSPENASPDLEKFKTVCRDILKIPQEAIETLIEMPQSNRQTMLHELNQIDRSKTIYKSNIENICVRLKIPAPIKNHLLSNPDPLLSIINLITALDFLNQVK